MSQFDVFALPGGPLVVDCQADLLSDLDTRFVVPLLPPELVKAVSRLNPTFAMQHGSFILFPQAAATVLVGELRERIGSLADEGFTILNALDLLLTGA